MSTAQATGYPQTFPAPDPLDVSIELGSGDITVTADDVTEATVDLAPASAGDPDAVDLIARSRVELRGKALRIEVPHRTGFRRTPEIVITATVPTTSTLSVKSGSADVRTNGTFGDIKLTTGSGDVWVETAATGKDWTAGRVQVGVRSAASIKSGSGDITVGRSHGELSVATGSGDVRFDDLGGDAEVTTASGDVDVNALAGNVAAKTASGDVTVRHAAEGELEAKTASGRVSVGVAEGTAAHLDCTSVTGRCRSDLSPADEPTGDDALRLVIRARTVSGSITIAKTT